VLNPMGFGRSNLLKLADMACGCNTCNGNHFAHRFPRILNRAVSRSWPGAIS
jgi:hypothetical protein